MKYLLVLAALVALSGAFEFNSRGSFHGLLNRALNAAQNIKKQNELLKNTNNRSNKPNVVQQLEFDGNSLLINKESDKIVGVTRQKGNELNWVGNVIAVKQPDGTTLLVDQDTGEVPGILAKDVPVLPPPTSADGRSIDKHPETGNVLAVFFEKDKPGVLLNRDSGAVLGQLESLQDKLVFNDDLILVSQNVTIGYVVTKANGDVVGIVGRLIEIIFKNGDIIYAERTTLKTESIVHLGLGFIGKPNPYGNSRSNYENNGNTVGDNNSYNNNNNNNKNNGNNKGKFRNDKKPQFGNEELEVPDINDQGNIVAKVESNENVIYYNKENKKIVAVKRENSENKKYIGNLQPVKQGNGHALVVNKDNSVVEGEFGRVIRVERPGLTLLVDRITEKLLALVAENGLIFLLNSETIENGNSNQNGKKSNRSYRSHHGVNSRHFG